MTSNDLTNKMIKISFFIHILQFQYPKLFLLRKYKNYIKTKEILFSIFRDPFYYILQQKIIFFYTTCRNLGK